LPDVEKAKHQASKKGEIMGNQVAKDVVADCTSCKMDLIHSIVAVDGDKILKVFCGTCKKEHNYRLAKELKGASTSKKITKNAVHKKSRSVAAEWESEIASCKHLSAKRYSFDGCFGVGEKLTHATFGVGLVKRLLFPNKMEVLFKEGTKLLVRHDSEANSPSST
jgi:Fe-S oxidoreductase